ncbi:MAG: hypothetical protein IPH72_17845 [Sandaracinaceae bacterium]|nr:hypothetical protein [Sandaracinaceae bacterium]
MRTKSARTPAFSSSAPSDIISMDGPISCTEPAGSIHVRAAPAQAYHSPADADSR